MTCRQLSAVGCNERNRRGANLMTSWLVLSLILRLGVISGTESIAPPVGTVATFEYPSQSITSTIGVSVTAFRILELSTAIKSYETPAGGMLFSPYRVDYTAQAALMLDPFSLVVRHECDHSIDDYAHRSWSGGTKTEVYVQMKVSNLGARN